MSRVQNIWSVFTTSQKVMLGILIPVLLMVLLSVAMISLPYRPLHVYGYDVVPEKVCPNEPIQMYIDSKLTDHIKELKIQYQWVDTRTGQPEFGDTETVYNLKPYERKVAPTIVARSASAVPGIYMMETEYDAFGKRVGTPARQDLSVATEREFLTVLSPNDPQCVKGEGTD